MKVYRNLKRVSLWERNIGFLGIEFRLIEILRQEEGLVLEWARLGLGEWKEQAVLSELGQGVKFRERALLGG